MAGMMSLLMLLTSFGDYDSDETLKWIIKFGVCLLVSLLATTAHWYTMKGRYPHYPNRDDEGNLY